MPYFSSKLKRFDTIIGPDKGGNSGQEGQINFPRHLSMMAIDAIKYNGQSLCAQAIKIYLSHRKSILLLEGLYFTLEDWGGESWLIRRYEALS